jgi:fucose permease
MSEAGALVGRAELWLLAAMLFVYVACEVGVFNWLVKYLMSVNVAESTAKSVVGWGFGGGLVIGRLVISGLLTKLNLRPIDVTLYAAVAMAVTTFAMLQVTEPTMVGVVVFLAGIAMAPVFPTTLAIVGDAFPKATATAMGIVITAGWTGLAVSSAIIGSLSKESGLGTALMVLPVSAVIMAIANLLLRPMLAKKDAAKAARA